MLLPIEDADIEMLKDEIALLKAEIQMLHGLTTSLETKLKAAEGLAEAVEYNLELLRKADTYPIESAFRPTKENWVAATDSVKQALAAWKAAND